MSRYRGPRVKITNRLRAFLPGLIDKKFKIKERKKYFRYKKIPKQYNNCLIEKQKLRFHYGLTERQLVRYMRIAGKSKGSTGQVLLQLLEMRLDNILFRLSMAWTIREARQLVNHRHILVNGRIVDIPSYRCKPGDIIATKDNQKSKDLIRRCIGLTRQRKTRLLPKHLSINSREYKARVKKIIDRTEVYLKINEFLVVQYYSRQI